MVLGSGPWGHVLRSRCILAGGLGEPGEGRPTPRSAALRRVALALALVACQGDESGTSETGSTTEPDTPSSGALEDPRWSECFGPYESHDYPTCAAACAAEGRLCRPKGCDGVTLESHVLPRCYGTERAEENGCLDEINVAANTFRCCCV
ncbi:MAG: hypothetical protein R3B09_02445 [Nannocystaceae bacterium]